MNAYETVTEAVNDLSKKGYTASFNNQEANNNFSTINSSPEHFTIDDIFRFEGETDPADETIVIAVSSTQHNIKGILVNGYGIYDDAATSEVIKKLILSEQNIAYRHQFE
jgi:hypothetical protein